MKIDHDMEFLWCITGQQKIPEWAMKSENNVLIARSSQNGTVSMD